ncbi:hypothetical protein ABTX85_37620 [Streptomyces sp. NPDC096097]|uniref:hypothetical protein n=1 Tax=Streptomyces sp. NPDC096097 TaxID=3155546 RepID=UPI00331F9105
MSVKISTVRVTGTLVALSIATALLAATPAGADGLRAGSIGSNAAPSPTTDIERPQGQPGPLKTEGAKDTFSAAAATADSAGPISRSTVIARAKTWVDAQVPYSQSSYRDGYRTDCSGLVSMAWNLGTNAWTGDLDTYADRISKNELRKGDMLLFHNAANPVSGSHVVLFESWTDSSMTSYIGIEQTPPHAVRRVIPYAYFKNSSSYIPYRYKNIVEDAIPATAGVYRPGESVFYVSDKNGNVSGYAGFGAQGDVPLTGDWNKDGKDTFGVYRPETHTFLLTDNNSSVTMESTFGDAGDVPLVGDWDGDGKDTIGVYRPGEQTFYLTNDNLNVARTLKMGDAGDKPITGDWNGDGKDTVGIYRPANQTFYLSDSSTSADVNHQITFGSPGDLPIKGDWNGDGTDKIGVYRPTESDFFGAAKDSDTVIYSARFGNPGDIPTTGQW